MTYLDRTFCPASTCATYPRCPRALTQHVKDGAKRAGLHISQFVNPHGLDCFVPPANQNKETS